MRLSLALCTYQGERYLPDQLASICAQTRPPDEVVVCDDASSDSTVAIVRDFAATAPFPVRLTVNAHTLGSTRNFAGAMAQCQGDVIALADQDDVWFPHKMAALEAALAARPDAGFVFSDAVLTTETLAPRGDTLWQSLRFGRRERQRFLRGDAFACLLQRYRVTGATLAFRASYRELVLPIPADWHHDAWIALAISALAACALVSEPLLFYRQHSGQQLGRPQRGPFAKYRLARAMRRDAYEREVERLRALQARLDGDPRVRPDNRVRLARKLDHLVARAALRDAGVWRLPHILRECARGNYFRFSAGWKSIAQDLLT